jgi:hypothetical protein
LSAGIAQTNYKRLFFSSAYSDFVIFLISSTAFMMQSTPARRRFFLIFFIDTQLILTIVIS